MELNSEQKELIKLFVEQEYLIGRLYQLFAKKYPEYNGFWTEMANEEYQHASLIKRLTESDTVHQIRFSQGELRSSLLVSSMKFISDNANEIRNNKEYPLIQAISIALHLEKALWEKNIFQHFEGDSSEVKRIMESLSLEQGIHIHKLEEFASHFYKKDAQR